MPVLNASTIEEKNHEENRYEKADRLTCWSGPELGLAARATPRALRSDEQMLAVIIAQPGTVGMIAIRCSSFTNKKPYLPRPQPSKHQKWQEHG